MRWIQLIMAALFALGAAVQWNDPDPWRWVLYYLALATLSLAAWRGFYLPRFTLTLAGLSILAVIPLIPALAQATLSSFSTLSMAAEDEQAREAGGLLLGGLWLSWLGYSGWRVLRRANGTVISAKG